MPDPSIVHSGTINRDYNYLFYMFITIAVVLSIYLTWKGLTAGIIYATMFFGITSLMFWVFFWVKNDNTLGPILKYLKVPISTKLTLSAFLYLVALPLPALLQLIIKLSGRSYDVTKLSVALFSASLDQAFQTYSAAEVGSSMSWRIFLTMFEAGTMETFVYNFGIPIISVIFGLGLFALAVKKGKDTAWGMPRKVFVFGFSVIFMPVLLFIFSHVMNQTYTLFEFIMAGIFLLISNASIYFVGATLLFWVGYHQGNNLLALIINEGLLNVSQGFLSWFGIIYIPLLCLIIYHVITNLDWLIKDLKWYIRN